MLYQANGKNLHRTAREFRANDGGAVPLSTLQRWFREQAATIPIELRTKKASDLRDTLQLVAWAALNEILVRIGNGEGALKDLAVVFGVAIEKGLLLEDKPTERIAVVNESLTDDERTARTAALFDAARARRAGQASDRADWAD